MRLRILLICMIIAGLQADLFAQRKKDDIKYKADRLTRVKKDGKRVRKLIGNVVFTQKGVKVYCDSSYFYSKQNVMEAFGRVRIVDDSVNITAKKLIYRGNERKAELRENVVYRRGKKFLYTDFLDYDMRNDISEFSNGGKLVDESNTLTSEVGTFYGKRDFAIFNDDVLLVAPDFNLRSDILEYQTITKVAVTKGKTFIENHDGTTVHSNGGTFFTKSDQTTFRRGTIETKNYIITGDELFSDDQNKFYRAIGNVVMTSKKDNVIIHGDETTYDKKTGISLVWGRPLMKRIMQQDTLYMTSDTLKSIEHADKDKERILAYYNIKIYKKDLQGKCDSLAYFLADSTMHMYVNPIMWNFNNQMAGDSIDLVFKNNLIDQMIIKKRAFLISEDTLSQYNQVKGRDMVGFFDQGRIKSMDVNGNGESHYFVLDDGDSLLVGMNKMFCSSMKIRFVNQQLDNISFYKQPEAKFIPPHELTFEQQFLEGFDWQVDIRPKKEDVIQRKMQLGESKPEQLTKKVIMDNAQKRLAAPNQLQKLDLKKAKGTLKKQLN